MGKIIAAAAAFTAGVLLTFAAWTVSDRPRESSADRTIYSFVHAVRHHNYGRACSWFVEDMRGTSETQCGQGVTASIGGAMQFGLDPYAEAYVKPGSKAVVDKTTVTYVVGTRDGVVADYLFTVTRLGNGRWRISKTGAA